MGFRFLFEFHSGVVLFFVLSGFLISWNYLAAAELQQRWLGTFYFRRFSRIFPLLFVISLMDMLLAQARPLD